MGKIREMETENVMWLSRHTIYFFGKYTFLSDIWISQQALEYGKYVFFGNCDIN